MDSGLRMEANLMKKILKKTGIAFMVAVAGFTTASSWTVIYAGWVPVAGIDYPFDPANYYTQTTVSIPDKTKHDLSNASGLSVLVRIHTAGIECPIDV